MTPRLRDLKALRCVLAERIEELDAGGDTELADEIDALRRENEDAIDALRNQERHI